MQWVKIQLKTATGNNRFAKPTRLTSSTNRAQKNALQGRAFALPY